MTRRFELPPARMRRASNGGEIRKITLQLEVVTPIYGGGTQPRDVDDVDVIRVPSIRGNLRFWWRALQSPRFVDASMLSAAESSLWGSAASDDSTRSRPQGGRSSVEVSLPLLAGHDEFDEGDIKQSDRSSYALWPARADRDGTPPARRRKPGVRFELTLLVPESREREVLDAVRAWVLFGGYGGRTRRGLGALCLRSGDLSMPKRALKAEIQGAFGYNVFDLDTPSRETPCLAGARCLVGPEFRDAAKAWDMSLKWLSDFRQGSSGNEGDRAREPAGKRPNPARPHISNWPEPDKIRHLTGKTGSHPPRYNKTPAWPRAGFGLPIIGRFQSKDRGGGFFTSEPGQFELRWTDGMEVHDRLASPLIVKPLPLAGGGFVPCALWLNRAYPAGEVILAGKAGSSKLANSSAPFDRLLADGDTPMFSALSGKASLRDAFCDWLVRNGAAELT